MNVNSEEFQKKLNDILNNYHLFTVIILAFRCHLLLK